MFSESDRDAKPMNLFSPNLNLLLIYSGKEFLHGLEEMKLQYRIKFTRHLSGAPIVQQIPGSWLDTCEVRPPLLPGSSCLILAWLKQKKASSPRHQNIGL